MVLLREIKEADFMKRLTLWKTLTDDGFNVEMVDDIIKVYVKEVA